MTTECEEMTERQAFEEWLYTSRPSPITPLRSEAIEAHWRTWQAAIARLSHAAEPVLTIQDHDVTGEDEPFWWLRGQDLGKAMALPPGTKLYALNKLEHIRKES